VPGTHPAGHPSGRQAGGEALLAAGVSLGYSLSCTLVKNWQASGLAQAVAVDFGKATVSEGVDQAAEAGAVRALAEHAKNEQVLRSVQGMVRQASARLSAQGLSRRQAQMTSKGRAHAQGLEARATQHLA